MTTLADVVEDIWRKNAMMPNAIFSRDLWNAVQDLSSALFRKFSDPNRDESEYWYSVAKRAVFHGETYDRDWQVINYITDWLMEHRTGYNGAIRENLGARFFG